MGVVNHLFFGRHVHIFNIFEIPAEMLLQYLGRDPVKMASLAHSSGITPTPTSIRYMMDIFKKNVSSLSSPDFMKYLSTFPKDEQENVIAKMLRDSAMISLYVAGITTGLCTIDKIAEIIMRADEFFGEGDVELLAVSVIHHSHNGDEPVTVQIANSDSAVNQELSDQLRQLSRTDYDFHSGLMHFGLVTDGFAFESMGVFYQAMDVDIQYLDLNMGDHSVMVMYHRGEPVLAPFSMDEVVTSASLDYPNGENDEKPGPHSGPPPHPWMN